MAHNGVCSCCGLTADEAIADYNKKRSIAAKKKLVK